MKRAMTICLVLSAMYLSGQESVPLSELSENAELSEFRGFSGSFGFFDEQEPYIDPTSDRGLSLRPIEGNERLFEDIARFAFNSVGRNRRGLDPVRSSFISNGMELTGLISGRVDWGLLGQVRNASRRGERLTDGGFELGGRWRCDMLPKRIATGNRLMINFSDRTLRYGLRYDMAWGGRTRWLLSANRSFGRDGHIDGVFGDMGAASLSVQMGGLVVAAHLAVSQRGTRSYSTREAFELTGDNLYNPAWGPWGDRQRNSRVRENFTPTISAMYDKRLGEATTVSLAAGVRHGIGSYSSPAWYEASNPAPDYYRYMPDYLGDTPAGELAREQWLARDPTVTQIDWDELLRRNANSVGLPAYILE
ncbi:MAG: hypothetical protein LBH06_03235, partial [Rikenellaceae bacterium]|nr:hypothetical protein [Rikenellaceae bacterium]